MAYGKTKPPASAVIQTDATRAAALADLAEETTDEDGAGEEDSGGVDESYAGARDEAGPPADTKGAAPDKLGDASSNLVEFATEVLGGGDRQQPVAGWADSLKTQLVAAGLNDQAAHTLAHKAGRENAEKVLAGLTGGVSSGSAHPAPGTKTPKSSAGLSLSKELLARLDGPAKEELGSALSAVQESAREEVASLREDVAFLRGKTIQSDAATLSQRLVETRTELQGTYPELNISKEWDRLKPIVKAMVSSGAVDDATEGLRLAAIKLYGVRAATTTGSSKQTTAGKLLRGRNSASGNSAATQAAAKGALSKLIFNGAPAAMIDEASRAYRELI